VLKGEASIGIELTPTVDVLRRAFDCKEQIY
jgi:hypothetical protein